MKIGDTIQVVTGGGQPRTGVVVHIEDDLNLHHQPSTKVTFKDTKSNKLDMAILQLDKVMLLTPNGLIPVNPPPPPAPPPKKVYCSEAEILREYPIVVMFRLVKKDHDRFVRWAIKHLFRLGRKDLDESEQPRIGATEYSQFYNSLSPDFRSTSQYFNLNLADLMKNGLVSPKSNPIGRFVVLPVQGNGGDTPLGENFLLMEQERGLLVWLGSKLSEDAESGAFKLILQAMKAAWDDSQDFEIGHAEIRARGKQGRVKIPFREIDFNNLDRPEGSLIAFLVCLQKNFATLTTLNPPPAPCAKKLGSIQRAYTK